MKEYINKNWKNGLLVVFLSLLTALVVRVVFPPKVKDGYIELKTVFDEFEYTKELKKEFMVVDQSRKKKLDSVEFELKILAKKLEEKNDKNIADVFEVKRQDYIRMKQEFESQNGVMTNQFDEKIHSQITQYVKDFGEENGYVYIYGTESLGNILYAKDKKNLTKEVLNYINKKYKGK